MEALWGTAEGDRQKRVHLNGGYERLRCATMRYAMLEHLINPPLGFEELIKTHFKLKREYITGVVQQWLQEAKDSDTKGM